MKYLKHPLSTEGEERVTHPPIGGAGWLNIRRAFNVWWRGLTRSSLRSITLSSASGKEGWRNNE
jgi:hypothetical protein